MKLKNTHCALINQTYNGKCRPEENAIGVSLQERHSAQIMYFCQMLKSRLPQLEFVLLMASLMSIVALGIDALLPALDVIGTAVGSSGPVENQQIIIMIFLGLGMGPLIFGPISDSWGRKPAVILSFVFFILSSLICVYAQSMTAMLIGRVLQGVALSAPRTISIAMVRDVYSGNFMARIMSFITSIFILIPVIAPTLGKWILDSYNWQAIFYFQLAFAILVCIWFWRRQPETLADTNRIPFSRHLFSDGLVELLKFKRTMGFTLISGLITGSFLVYLSTAQQVFEDQYGLKEEFPYIFAGLAISIGLATFLNGTLVLKFGMEKLITISLFGYFAVSLVYMLLYFYGGNPPVEQLFVFFALQFFAVAIIFGNLRAIAMEPIGHIAGIGAAITGFISTMMSVPISTYIGGFVEDTALPLFIGFSICSLLAIAILYYLKIWVKEEAFQEVVKTKVF